MNTNFLSLLAVASVLVVGSPVVGLRAESETSAASATSLKEAWQKHVLSVLPAGLSATAVTWDPSSTALEVRFQLTVRANVARYERVSFFNEKESGPVADLRAALLEANKPVDYLKMVVPAGKKFAVEGSFDRTLDGQFSPVVWGPELSQTVVEMAGLPKEGSNHFNQMQAKVAEARRDKMVSDLTGFVRGLGTAAEGVAQVTGNPEAAKVAKVAKGLVGTNSVPSNAGGGDLGKAVKQVGGALQALGVFGRK